ncbi:TPA: DUF1108 family protein [Staphylococcus pseudintermedius]|uniref:DUF1108 family protein n=1 Tax=Staphylococcus pseudintermedius TaxID=283734 RepID=A0A317YUL9_STAPS|nr:DUF1108 family protein [Staphylococcus pseudintermedius]EGQ0321857.1 DUF1108 family protein [Staphylococcus pseudintermedius]EGQ0325861.1 DUF1108 family protein [Staphylococcus pseudintermedius]EGQ0369451.1 DUF1108 family protein [Staphylococcus pseudintermedius]EGQ1303548.1 DUF1108 family protein [Staphylococcus pseudintermedius]EGQ1308616.1 DUF1108 family protein [Staphylococcus pseudintermedius]
MYFKEGSTRNEIINVEGFYLRKSLKRQEDHISIKIYTFDWELISEVDVYDYQDIEAVEEILSKDIYNYITFDTDDLDRLMIHFIK